MSETIAGIVALLLVVSISLLISRVATCMLTFTGLSQDLARFQARSALTGCGFTTHEAEHIAQHPVRRRIIMVLMLMGNGAIVLMVSSLIPIMTGDDNLLSVGWWTRMLWLIGGLAGLWALAASKWIDRQLFRITSWALRHFTALEIRDYHGLLNLSDGYTVTEMSMQRGDWLVGKPLIQSRLGDEGIHVLGIRRKEGNYIGAPTGATYVRAGDDIILYGKAEHLAELDERQAGPEGDRAHKERCDEQRKIVEQQAQKDRPGARLDVRDYFGLLQLGGGYTVMEVVIDEDEWLAGKNLAELRLGDEGIHVLGIRRKKGNYVGAPIGETRVLPGDHMVLYGREEHVAELDKRPSGPEGDLAHRQRQEEQERLVREEAERDKDTDTPANGTAGTGPATQPAQD